VVGLAERTSHPLVRSAAFRAAGLAVRASEPERAVRLFQSGIAVSLTLNDSELRHLVALDCIEGLAPLDSGRALSSASQIEDPEARALALWRIAGQLVSINPRDALLVLTEAAQRAAQITAPHRRVRVLLGISTALGGLDPARSAPLFESAVREIPTVPSDADQVALLNLARDCAQALRERGVGQVGVPAEVTGKRLAALRAVVAAAKQVKKPEEQCLAVWQAAAELSRWDAEESLPAFDAAIQLFEQVLLPRYQQIDADHPERAEESAAREVWPILRIAGRDLLSVSRERAQRTFDAALKMAGELTVRMPAKPLKYGLWGLAGSEVDPRPARGYATIRVASELGWMDLGEATRLIEAAEVPRGKMGGLMGFGASLGKGLAKLFGKDVVEAAPSTPIARAGALLDLSMVASVSDPGQAAGLYRKALEVLFTSKYRWTTIWKGVRDKERGDPTTKAAMAVPLLWTNFFRDEADFAQKLLSAFYAVAQTPAWNDQQTRMELVAKTKDLATQAIPDYTCVGTLCSLSSFLAEGEGRQPDRNP
jgi:hypothetical protein